MTTTKRTAVRFLKAAQGYRTGEVAQFLPEAVARLIAAGEAELADQPHGGTTDGEQTVPATAASADSGDVAGQGSGSSGAQASDAAAEEAKRDAGDEAEAADEPKRGRRRRGAQ